MLTETGRWSRGEGCRKRDGAGLTSTGLIASTKALAVELAGIEIIGQHDQLSLTRPAEVRALVDANLDRSGRALLDAYRSIRNTWQDLLNDRDQLGGDRRAIARELDLVRFQAEEISAAGFAPGDDRGIGGAGQPPSQRRIPHVPARRCPGGS